MEFIPREATDLCKLGDAYDEDSIMHYPGGAGAKKPLLGHRKTVLGTKADPNTSFKKNTKPSSSDVRRANEMYSGQGNQKRDAAECGPQEQQPAPANAPEPEDEDDAEDSRRMWRRKRRMRKKKLRMITTIRGGMAERQGRFGGMRFAACSDDKM